METSVPLPGHLGQEQLGGLVGVRVRPGLGTRSPRTVTLPTATGFRGAGEGPCLRPGHTEGLGLLASELHGTRCPRGPRAWPHLHPHPPEGSTGSHPTCGPLLPVGPCSGWILGWWALSSPGSAPVQSPVTKRDVQWPLSAPNLSGAVIAVTARAPLWVVAKACVPFLPSARQGQPDPVRAGPRPVSLDSRPITLSDLGVGGGRWPRPWPCGPPGTLGEQRLLGPLPWARPVPTCAPCPCAWHPCCGSPSRVTHCLQRLPWTLSSDEEMEAQTGHS